MHMQKKAVIFDLFETLITEWGHEKYTKNQMCADLQLDRTAFDLYWDEKEEGRYTGEISFSDSIRYVCERCGMSCDDVLLAKIVEKRKRTKAACFSCVQPEVYRLLEELKARGMRLALCSNCSSEEVEVLRESDICRYFDAIILSYAEGIRKPDARIYQMAAERLCVPIPACVFVGDGGSHELEGASAVGMTAVQAKWYTNQHPNKRDSMAGFFHAEDPEAVLQYLD